jgi:dipeptidyl aminopeptidase/acylaminoacyl peptidase
VHADAPPFLVIHGSADSIIPVAQARAFVDALRRVSTSPVAYAELPDAQHAFDMMYNIRTAHTVDAVERFLDLARVAATAKVRRPT